MASPETFGGKTIQEIEALKRKHKTKSIYFIEVPHEEETLAFWFKKPDMTTVSAMAAVGASNPMAGTMVMFEDCLIEGDMSYKDDVDVFPAIAAEMASFIEPVKATLKKF